MAPAGGASRIRRPPPHGSGPMMGPSSSHGPGVSSPSPSGDAPTGPDASSPSPLLRDHGERDGPPLLRWLLGLFLVPVGILLALGLKGAAGSRDPRIPDLIAKHLPETGVSNPVTGVLLNFRGYDTLLEIAVLVAAMVAVWSLDRGQRHFGLPASASASGGAGGGRPFLSAILRLAVPTAFLTAVYLTWMGSSEPAGAFQAGALLAGAGVLLSVAGVLRPLTAAALPVRIVAAGGVAGFVVTGIAVLPFTGAFLAYPEGWAYPLILGLEAALAVAVAVILVELFVDVPSIPAHDAALDAVDPYGDPLGRALAPDPSPADPEAP
ncbi:MAG: hypothetical protein EA352_10235 [Gemmatimonadales bacterium]|nr:MAG: hypothetical protein EA352_10235 [Gemmatimonadales bacterium]